MYEYKLETSEILHVLSEADCESSRAEFEYRSKGLRSNSGIETPVSPSLPFIVSQ